MVTVYLIDAYAWIEYLKGSKEGKILSKLFSGTGKFVTLECTLSELFMYTLRCSLEFSPLLKRVKENSVILPVLREHWLEAAHLRHILRKKISNFGIIDAILVAKQKELGSSIITGDPHFKTLPNIVFLPVEA